MAKKNEALTQEELALYTNYLINGEVETEEEAAKVEELKARPITLDEAGSLIKFVTGYTIQNMNAMIGNVMEQVQIQGIVLEKLGANNKVFKDAKVKYNKRLVEAQAQIAAQYPELNPQEEPTKEEK